MTLGGMGETMAVEGSTDRGVFEAYVEHALAPTLEAGRVVIMDNLLSPQTGQGERADRGEGLRADLPTRLLSGPQPDRGSVGQDQGHAASSGGPHQGRFGGGIGRSAFGGQRPRRPKLFRACRLSSSSPSTVKRAVRPRLGGGACYRELPRIPIPRTPVNSRIGATKDRDAPEGFEAGRLSTSGRLGTGWSGTP